jgi:hypothetical protein
MERSPSPVSSAPSSSSSSISTEEIPIPPRRKRARTTQQATKAGAAPDKPKRPRKEAPRHRHSKEDSADPAPNAAAGGGGGKRSSVYRGVTRYSIHSICMHSVSLFLRFSSLLLSSIPIAIQRGPCIVARFAKIISLNPIANPLRALHCCQVRQKKIPKGCQFRFHK